MEIIGDIKNDKTLREAMLASSLFFLKTKQTTKREDLFIKAVLALVISGKAKTVQEIVKYYISSDFTVDETKVKSAIDSLKKDKVVDVNENGDLYIVPNKKNDIDSFVKEIDDELKQLINDIANKVISAYPKGKDSIEQIKTNIKDCLQYYFYVSSLSFFNIDDSKDINEMDSIFSIASKNLTSKNNELANHIIGVIASIINDTDKHSYEILEKIARMHVSAQLMNQDPLLANFKATQIRGKQFVLDTDVVLYAITDNASRSKQYSLMIKALLKCGCEVYIPEEIINEVYDHGEASFKRYQFVSNIVGVPDDEAPKNLRNVFIEDYHYTKIKKNGTTNWNTFINNFWNKEHGVVYTREVIKYKLGNQIHYDELPANENYNKAEYEKLQALTLELTQKTEKASHRPEHKNENIAKADSRIYLVIKNYNNSIRKNNEKNTGVLINPCYFVTISYRVHNCAKRLGLEADVLCHPKKLIAYLSESGLIDNKAVSFIKLFDNPFLIYTAFLVQEDVNALLGAGVDLKGRNAISMKYDLEKEIQLLLTDANVEDFKSFYSSVESKGYKFREEIARVMNDNEGDKKTIQQQKEELSKKDKIIDNQSKTIARLLYVNRVKDSHKKGSRNEKLKRKR